MIKKFLYKHYVHRAWKKAAKSIAHGVVAEISARMAGNKAGSGFYAGATNEALIGEINKIAKDRPDVAQWLSASLGAVVNASMGNSPVTGGAVAQYGTKWNASGKIKTAKELKPGESINVIKPGELSESGSNEAYLRTKWGDYYVPYGLFPGDIAVVQYATPGDQSLGQEVVINSDRSYTSVDEPLGLVIPEFKTSLYPNVENKKYDWYYGEPLRRKLKAEWYESTTGRYYKEYNNGDIEPTDRYVGVENWRMGYPLERVTLNGGTDFYYISNGYYVPETEETKEALRRAEVDFVTQLSMELAGGGRGGAASVGKVGAVVSQPAKYQLKSISLIPKKTIEKFPTNVRLAYERYTEVGWRGNYSGQTPRTAANKSYRNKDNQLPQVDNNGNPIIYKEFDVNNYIGPKRDSERFVRGSDGSVYYTNNHYKSFTKIE